MPLQAINLPIPLVLLLVVGLLLRRRPFGRLLVGLSTVGLVLMTLPATGKVMLAPLASAARTIAAADMPGAVAVPTSGIYRDRSGAWWPEAESLRRTVDGLMLSRRHGIPLIVSGGVTDEGRPPEAEVVAEVLGALDEVMLDVESRNSRENAAGIAAAAKRLKIELVLLATSDRHVARMAACLRHEGLKVVTAERPEVRLGWRDFLPQVAALGAVRVAAYEYAAIAWYLIAGHIELHNLI